jgi:long-chain acyl-CoA synthetase
MAINPSKPWLKNYPEGVPYEIGPLSHSSLTQFLDECFDRFGNRKAIEAMGKFFSYKELDRLSKDFASYLQTLNLEKGARVALMYPNVIEYVVAMIGTLRAGYVVVNINPLYTARELEAQLIDSGASVLVVMENFAHRYQEINPIAGIVQVIVSSPGELMGIKGYVINWVARSIKKLIPPWQFAHITFKEAIQKGGTHHFQKPHI